MTTFVEHGVWRSRTDVVRCKDRAVVAGPVRVREPSSKPPPWAVAPGRIGQLSLWLERPAGLVLEQRQQNLRSLIGDRQGLNAKLLLDLKRLEFGAFLGQVGINQVSDPDFQGIHEL